MKTLKEQVEEIKNMKGSRAAKKAAFVKLGLRKYEVELLMAEMPKAITSIRGENPIECVSPVLTGKAGMKSLETCCKALNDAGAQVNKSTGLHVHIGAANLSDEAYINVFENYQKLEKVIDTFMAKSRRANNSQWCRTLQGKNFDLCMTKHDVFSVMNGNRYFKVNACSYSRHNTIEFRQHQGSTDFEKISNWVNFCAKLVAWSKKECIEVRG